MERLGGDPQPLSAFRPGRTALDADIVRLTTSKTGRTTARSWSMMRRHWREVERLLVHKPSGNDNVWNKITFSDGPSR